MADWIANVRNGFKFKYTSGYYERDSTSDDVYRVIYYIFKEGIVEKIKSWINENRMFSCLMTATIFREQVCSDGWQSLYLKASKMLNCPFG